MKSINQLVNICLKKTVPLFIFMIVAFQGKTQDTTNITSISNPSLFEYYEDENDIPADQFTLYKEDIGAVRRHLQLGLKRVYVCDNAVMYFEKDSLTYALTELYMFSNSLDEFVAMTSKYLFTRSEIYKMFNGTGQNIPFPVDQKYQIESVHNNQVITFFSPHNRLISLFPFKRENAQFENTQLLEGETCNMGNYFISTTTGSYVLGNDSLGTFQRDVFLCDANLLFYEAGIHMGDSNIVKLVNFSNNQTCLLDKSLAMVSFDSKKHQPLVDSLRKKGIPTERFFTKKMLDILLQEQNHTDHFFAMEGCFDPNYALAYNSHEFSSKEHNFHYFIDSTSTGFFKNFVEIAKFISSIDSLESGQKTKVYIQISAHSDGKSIYLGNTRKNSEFHKKKIKQFKEYADLFANEYVELVFILDMCKSGIKNGFADNLWTSLNLQHHPSASMYALENIDHLELVYDDQGNIIGIRSANQKEISVFSSQLIPDIPVLQY